MEYSRLEQHASEVSLAKVPEPLKDLLLLDLNVIIPVLPDNDSFPSPRELSVLERMGASSTIDC